MRFFHLSDLHLGQMLYGYSLIEDQEAILNQIVDKASQWKPDAVLIAGDIYDKSTPSAEAVSLLDNFLTKLDVLSIPVFLISGNHDSAQRLDFASHILSHHGVHISGLPPKTSNDYLKKVVLSDTKGEVNFYLLPFVKPSWIRTIAREEQPALEIRNYTDAIKFLLDRESIDSTCRNVLLSHQFYITETYIPSTCESERPSFLVGGLDYVNTSILDSFDYVALGHIHSPQCVGRQSIRYCGTPLKYSLSEEHQRKSISAVTLEEKGNLIIDEIPLIPLRDIQTLRGTLQEIIQCASSINTDNYVSITLTDEDELWNPKDTLEYYYHHILEIKLDNTRTRRQLEEIDEATPTTTPLEAFASFFKELQGRTLSEDETTYMRKLFQDLSGKDDSMK